MTGIDLGLENIWQSWFAFKKGKNATPELHAFQYSLEKNLYQLFLDLNTGRYRHGGYRKFIVCDNKRREISVAGIRDRVVHRLIYDYLEKKYDKTFIFDAWSCRKGKGLIGAIERAQGFLRGYWHPNGQAHGSAREPAFVWKADVKKFFDSVDHGTLLRIIFRKIKDDKTINLLREIIGTFSYAAKPGADMRVGMPIGNLTSQIFANIYLNELDRFVTRTLKPRAYLRYGDDFILVEPCPAILNHFRDETAGFLKNELKLELNPRSDRIMKAGHGLKFLGVIMWPSGRTLNRRNLVRAKERLDTGNGASYSGLIMKHGSEKQIGNFIWTVYEKAKPHF